MSPSLKLAHHYYAWIASKFLDVLGSRVLDIGGGDGPLLEHVVADDRDVTSLDLSAECVAGTMDRYRGRRIRGVVGDITDAPLAEKLANEGFDTILCTNVLEHIEDDEKALRHMAQILRSQRGRLFLLVPAHPFLYGTPDQIAGHFRRYSRPRLRACLEAAGFHVESLQFFNGAGALPYLINSRVIKPTSLGGGVDRQLRIFDKWIVPVARRLERCIRLPFGQSIIAIGRVGDLTK